MVCGKLYKLHYVSHFFLLFWMNRPLQFLPLPPPRRYSTRNAVSPARQPSPPPSPARSNPSSRPPYPSQASYASHASDHGAESPSPRGRSRPPPPSLSLPASEPLVPSLIPDLAQNDELLAAVTARVLQQIQVAAAPPAPPAAPVPAEAGKFRRKRLKESRLARGIYATLPNNLRFNFTQTVNSEGNAPIRARLANEVLTPRPRFFFFPFAFELVDAPFFRLSFL